MLFQLAQTDTRCCGIRQMRTSCPPPKHACQTSRTKGSSSPPIPKRFSSFLVRSVGRHSYRRVRHGGILTRVSTITVPAPVHDDLQTVQHGTMEDEAFTVEPVAQCTCLSSNLMCQCGWWVRRSSSSAAKADSASGVGEQHAFGSPPFSELVEFVHVSSHVDQHVLFLFS